MIHPLKKISKAWKSQGKLIRGGETLELLSSGMDSVWTSKTGLLQTGKRILKLKAGLLHRKDYVGKGPWILS